MKKMHVHVYLLAYNEEENIQQLILSLSNQKLQSIILNRITVMADGSKDHTPAIVRKLQTKIPLLSLRYFQNNKGKFYRLNQIFKQSSADIVVILDSDIQLIGEHFLEDLCKPITKRDSIMISAAHPQMIMPKNIIGKLVASSFLSWEYIRLSIPHFDSVHNFSSQATAYRGTFAQKLSIPKSALEERIYLYLMAKKENQNGFYYNTKAHIRYIPPSSFKDLLLMTKRPFGKKQKELDNIFHFSTEIILQVGRKHKIKGMVKAFLHHPFLTPIGLMLNFFIPRLATSQKEAQSTWERSNSTKKNIATL